MIELPEKLQGKLEERTINNSLRDVGERNQLIDFSSNDYLGFTKSNDIFIGSHQFLVENGFNQNGSTGSRLLSGNHPLFEIVEQKLAEIHNVESALLFNSGYDANVGILSCVPQRNDIILYDSFVHASIRDGIKLSNARAYAFQHNDMDDLALKMSKFSGEANIYVITESVFSMDGDIPDFDIIIKLSKQHQARIIVDEAHALGVFGLGLIQELGLESEIFARIVTFGKGLGCHGATVLGSESLKLYLVNFSRSFIYTTALAPHALSTIFVAYKFLSKWMQSDDINLLHFNIEFFIKICKLYKLSGFFINSRSAIQSCIIKGNKKARSIASILKDKGFDVKAILSPTVPEGQERLRFCIHNYNTQKEITEVLKELSLILN